MKKFFLTIILILINKNIYSNDIFDTSFYNIEFNSKNIEDDKLKEINKIKKESFLFILNETLDNKNFIKVNNYLTEDLINRFIQNIIINDEKIINDKYISKIKINFNKKKIINFFRQKNIPYVDYLPDKFLLIIYEKNKLDNNLLTKNNKHYKYYFTHLYEDNLFKIPNLDINDRFILTEEHIVSRDFEKINKFTKKYNSTDNLIIIVNYDKDKLVYDVILNSDGHTLEKKLLYNKTEMSLFFEELENETLELWKQINQIQNKHLNLLSCKVNYFNMLELKEIRNNLLSVSLISNLKIKKLAYKNIEYEIYYYGNLKILFKLFELNKLKINTNENSCIIRLI